MRRLLRLTSFAIAIAGVIDPAIEVSGAARARLAVVVQQPASPAADEVRARLIRDLSTSYEIVSQVDADAAAAVVIGDRYPDEPVPDALRIATVSTVDVATNGVRIVRVDAPPEVPPATVMRLDVELEALRLAGRTTDVTVGIAGLEIGRASHRWTAEEERWRASIDVVPVGDPPYVFRVEATEAMVRLKPDATGATVRLKPDTTETTVRLKPDTTETNVASGFSRTLPVADIVVDVRRAPFRVQFFDPRPSWATTFVRRALEGDRRFEVANLAFTSRGVSTRSGGDVPPGDPRLDGFDVVVVGGLDRLSAADARLIERYLRQRGGAVVLVPDQRIDAGPARDLISGPDLVERLLERPATLTVASPGASLQASELLVLGALAPATDVLARVPGTDSSTSSGSSRAESRDDGQPVIVTMPRGEGRLLLSGAMDAWRFRAADNGAFDRFWQSAIAGLALAVPAPIAISVVPALLRPGEPADVIVRVRSRDVTSVSASLDGDQPIRLRPEPEQGVYRGTFTAKSTAGRSILEVRAEGSSPPSASPGPEGPGLRAASLSAEGPGLRAASLSAEGPGLRAASLSAEGPGLRAASLSAEGPGLRAASRTLIIQPDILRIPPDAAPSLAMLASSHRGIDVTPDHVGDLERFLRNTVALPRTILLRHPMRSTWWILPFTACLSAEWWLRRRRGRR